PVLRILLGRRLPERGRTGFVLVDRWSLSERRSRGLGLRRDVGHHDQLQWHDDDRREDPLRPGFWRRHDLANEPGYGRRSALRSSEERTRLMKLGLIRLSTRAR